MTDPDLAAQTVAVNQLEITVHAYMAAADDAIERDMARAVARQAGALRRMLEHWIVNRATRAHQEQQQAAAAAHTR